METAKQDTILIVDDNPMNIKVLFGFLKEYEFKVLVAKDGESALEKLQEVLPDIILLDVQMPGIDGFETCRRLKASERTKDIPVIFMTALAEKQDKVKGLTLGAVDYITKPLQHEEVLARIKIHLRLRNLTLELQEKNELLQKTTSELEKRVSSRTAELRESLEKLQQAQIKLVQSEKMSSLGELVAGVAHEINNPVSFITGNVSLASEYTEQIFEHLRLYQEKFDAPGAEIEQHAEDIELDYLLEDLPKMLTSMEVGADRIRQISVSLRSFSRMDNTSKTQVNIHEGLDSTLMILQHRIKANDHRPDIQVIKEYGELPLVNCYPSPLNQVFMNILANAIDALDEDNINKGRSYEEIEQEPNRIVIKTSAIKSAEVEMIIADNGPGIPEKIKSQIFEPFVTTKPVGKGTGLGLSICNEIVVEKHGGSLECHSQPGEGTEFIIRIPQR